MSTIIQKCRDINIRHEIHAILRDFIYRETMYRNKKNNCLLNLTDCIEDILRSYLKNSPTTRFDSSDKTERAIATTNCKETAKRS
jgi:hypothetical protein